MQNLMILIKTMINVIIHANIYLISFINFLILIYLNSFLVYIKKIHKILFLFYIL